MDRNLYKAILAKVTLPLSAWPHCEAVARIFEVSVATVFSIYSQEVQNRVLRTNHIVKGSIASHAERYLSGEDLVQLAFELDFPPCVLLRRLLEELQVVSAKERITRVLRQPELLPALACPLALQRLAARAAAASPPGSGPQGAAGRPGGAAASSGGAAERALLERLQRDVQACVLCDRVFSPASDAARLSAGIEHEQRLNAQLAAAGVAFWTEDQLRSKGYHKTPDARLQVPIAVRGRIVNWIDSKATFGDDKLHRQQTVEQYLRYVNRFGPGLVIYWHGFIADLNQDDGVLLMDRFPRHEEIVQLPCLPLPPALPAPPAAGSRPAAASAHDAAAEGARESAPAAEQEQRTPVRQAPGQRQQGLRSRSLSPLAAQHLRVPPVNS